MAIDINVVLELFVAGIGLGFGSCFLFCAPLISSYILAKGFNHKEGLKFTVIFSAGRILAYSILGLVAVAFINTIGIQKSVFKQVGGILILLMLPVYGFFGEKIKFCNFIYKHIGQKTNINTFVLGFLIGLSPCAPLIGILTYIACKSGNMVCGFFYGLTFGIGTFFSPLVLLGLFAGLFMDFFSKSRNTVLFLKIIANIILVYFGIKLLV